MVPHSGTWRGGRWRLAPCLVAMEAEADRLAPNRRRTSDGSIGDHAHAVRRSDHNPDEEGVIDWVDALDISHDPANGMDIHAHARTIAARRDPRIDYIISNGRIWSRSKPTWRTYEGPNPHTLHAHFSVADTGRNDTSPWFAAVPTFPTAPTPPPLTPVPIPALISEDDEMYMRDTKTGTIYAVTNVHWQALSAEQWADRVKEGAGPKLQQLPPELVFHFLKSRKPA